MASLWIVAAGRERADVVVGGGVLAHDPLVRLGVAGVAVVRADDAGQLGRAPVGGAGHQRGDRRGERAAALGVVGVAGGHQQRAEVGVADAELAEGAGGLADLLGREVGEADGDVHRGDDQLDGLLRTARRRTGRRRRGTSSGSARPGCRRSCPGACTPQHGLDAVIRPGLRAGVPVVDRVVVLDAGVGALPGGLRRCCGTASWRRRLDDLAGHAGRAGRTRRRPRPRA